MEKGTFRKVLVIVPCFNEAESVASLYTELAAIGVPGCSVTPLFINDASTDSTLRVLRTLGASYLDNSVNLGIGGTVQLGFMYALQNGFDIAVQVDGDGQHPPSELHKLLEPLLDNRADVVIGSRFIHNTGFRSTGLRRAGIRVFVWLNRLLTGNVINDSTSGYRSYNRKAFSELVHYYPDEYPEPEALVYLANKRLRLLEVPVLMTERRGGSSSIRSLWSVYYMAKVTLNILFLHARRQ